MSNPYVSKVKRPVVATDLKFSGQRVVGNNGEVNAWDKKDLATQIASMLQTAKDSGIVTEQDAIAAEEIAQLRREAVEAAFADSQAHKELGSTLADELYIAGKREGFMRRVMARQEVVKGTFPHFRMRMKDVIAISAASPSQYQAQHVKDNLYTPPEFYIRARPFIEQREIEQSNSDVLESKYIEALEGTVVQEDRVWYRMANATINVSNPFTNIAGQLNTTTLAGMRTTVNRWSIPAVNCLVASDIWNDIIGEASFSGFIDPVSKHELLLTGQLAVVMGLTMYTDGFRHPQHRVFNEGDITIVGDPINHGIYTDRGGITALPIDATHERIPGRGWDLTMLLSMTIANTRSVARGNRA